jgi:hypothetical protein
LAWAEDVINEKCYSFITYRKLMEICTWLKVEFFFWCSLHTKIRIPFFFVYTVKPAHVVTSIKQSPVLKCHLFLVLENFLICNRRQHWRG